MNKSGPGEKEEEEGGRGWRVKMKKKKMKKRRKHKMHDELDGNSISLTHSLTHSFPSNESTIDEASSRIVSLNIMVYKYRFPHRKVMSFTHSLTHSLTHQRSRPNQTIRLTPMVS